MSFDFRTTKAEREERRLGLDKPRRSPLEERVDCLVNIAGRWVERSRVSERQLEEAGLRREE